MSNSHSPATMPEDGRYNETEIVRLITDIYKVLVRLGHFSDDDILWPPSSGHELPLSALA